MAHEPPQSPLQERFNRATSPSGQSNTLGSFHDLRVPNRRLQPFPSPSLALEAFGLNLVLPSPPESPPLSSYEGDDFGDELELTKTVTAIYSPLPNDVPGSTIVQPPVQKDPPSLLFVPPPFSPPGQDDASTSQCSTPRPHSAEMSSLPQSPRMPEPAILRRGAISAPCTCHHATRSDLPPVELVSPRLWTAELAVRTKIPRVAVTPLHSLQGGSTIGVEDPTLLSPVLETEDSMAEMVGGEMETGG